MAHLKTRLKGKQQLETRLSEMQKDNRLLLQKMALIVTQPSATSGDGHSIKSLNVLGRKRFLKDVDAENAALLKRLAALKPTYDRKTWANDRKTHEQLLKRL
ncbi:hypothetical protein M885DRAFT_429959, partial [Pelagophyceae sp. CCMP2097]